MENLIQFDLRPVFESLPGLYLILSRDLTIVAVSEAYLKATMTDRQAILGKGIFKVFPDNPDDPSATGVSNLRASLLYVLQKGAIHKMAIQKYDIRNSDGNFVERYWSPQNLPVFDVNHQLIYIIHCAEDVTEFLLGKEELEKQRLESETLLEQIEVKEVKILRHAQEIRMINDRLNELNIELEQRVKQRTAELERSQKRLQTILQTEPECVKLLGTQCELLEMNSSGLAMIEADSIEQVLGQSVLGIVSEKHRNSFQELTANVFRGKSGRLEFESIGLKGTHRWLETHAVPLQDEEGNIIALLGVTRDVTERNTADQKIRELNETLEKKIEERTQQWQAANQDLEAFSYSVSHDLRAPLRSIDSYTRILEEDYRDKLDDEGKRVVDTITRNTNRMSQLIDDMLNFSMVGRLAISPALINMNNVVNKIITELLEAEARFHVEFNIGDLTPARADLDMIIQVWTNYIGNAIKYSSKKASPLVEIGSHTEGNEIIYYVKDNGSGFDSQYIHKLFGVFQRLHRQNEFEGTGVGLAIVKRIIEKHNGRVWAEGMPNRGATFYFTLPLKPNSNE